MPPIKSMLEERLREVLFPLVSCAVHCVVSASVVCGALCVCARVLPLSGGLA